MIDTCAVDPLAELPGAFEAVADAIQRGALEILYTQVTLDELSGIDDPGKRSRLLEVLVTLGQQVATGGFILGVSRLDAARLTGDLDVAIIEDLRSNNAAAHSMDALIAITSHFEECALLTNEKRRLPSRARRQVD